MVFFMTVSPVYHYVEVSQLSSRGDQVAAAEIPELLEEMVE